MTKEASSANPIKPTYQARMRVRAVEKDRRHRDRGGELVAGRAGESVVVVPAAVVVVPAVVVSVAAVVVVIVVTPAAVVPVVIPVVVVPAVVIVVVVVRGQGGVRVRGGGRGGARGRGRGGFGDRRRRRIRGCTTLAALALPARFLRRPLVTVGLGPRTVPAARAVIARRCLGRFELLELDADGWAERLWAGPAGGGQQCTEDHPDQQGGKQDGNGEAAHRLPG